MTNEERDIISQFIARVGGAAPSQSGFAGGSVPATQQQPLPPIDREADGYISQMFNQYPEARYRITQLAFVQERALVEAQNRIKRLEWEVQQAQQAAQQQPQQRSGGGGFLGSLFGGDNRQQSAPPPQWNRGGPGPQQGYYQQSAPPPPPQYPPYMQQPLPRQGSGFLGSALTTAAGVAGGMVAGNALMSLFSPNHGMGGGAFGGGSSPWGGGDAAPQASQDYVDNGGWDQGQQTWDPNSGGDTSGWDQSSNSSDTGGWDSGGGDSGGWDSGSSDDTI